MEFYRKLEPKKLAKQAMKNKRASAITLVGFALFLYILFDNKGIVKRVQLEMEYTRASERVAAAELQNRQLQEQIRALEGDKKTIEKVARERYGMKRPRETVYRIKKD